MAARDSAYDRQRRQASAPKAAIEAAKGLIKGICDSQVFAGTLIYRTAVLPLT